MLAKTEIHAFKKQKDKRVPEKLKAGTYDASLVINEDGKVVGCTYDLTVVTAVSGTITMTDTVEG